MQRNAKKIKNISFENAALTKTKYYYFVLHLTCSASLSQTSSLHANQKPNFSLQKYSPINSSHSHRALSYSIIHHLVLWALLCFGFAFCSFVVSFSFALLLSVEFVVLEIFALSRWNSVYDVGLVLCFFLILLI